MRGLSSREQVRFACPASFRARYGEGRTARRILAVAAAVLVIAVLVVLPGCKYSAVLTQHLEDPEIGVLDLNAEPIYKNNPDAEERPDLDDISIAVSNDVNAQVAVLPHYDPNAPDNGPTLQRVKSPETPHDEEASEGDLEGEAEITGTGEEESEQGGEDVSNSEGDNDEGNNETEEETPEDPLEDTQSDEEELSDDGGGEGETVVVNPEGTEDETEKGTVAAVGEYATIAQMLGGAGALAACDEDWLAARKADGAFKGELDLVDSVFSGDGTASGSCDIEALVDAAPSVVLWDSAKNIPYLSESNKSALEKAGITVQPVSHIGEQGTEDYEVKAAVAEVASVLEGADGLSYDPADVLAQYNEFHDEVLKGCYDANGGYSYKVCDSQYNQLYQNTPLSGLNDSTTNRVVTVFVDDLWQPSVSSATVVQSAAHSTGTIELANDGKALDLTDGVCVSAKTSASGYMLIDYYLQLAGVVNNAYDTPAPASQNRSYIIMPGQTSAFGTSGNFASRISGTALFFNSGDATVAGNWHTLGDEDFNTMLVADDEIAQAVAASAAKADGLYYLENPYRIIVVPTGVAGAWSAGHIDSFLIAPWAFRIQSEENLESAEDYVSLFYSGFLRCDDWKSAVQDWDNAVSTG